MCKTQGAISEWCLDPMDCLCMLHKHIQSFLAYSIHHSHSFTLTTLLFFFGFFWLGFSSLSFSLFFLSPAVFPIAPPIYFSLALSVSAFSPLSHSIDGYYSFSAPYIPPGHVRCVFLFFCVFSRLGISSSLSLCFWTLLGSCGASPPPSLPCLLERSEIKHENANRHLQPMTNACTATAQKTSPLLNRHLASPDFISYLIRETQEWKGKSLFHFAIRTQPSCSL